MWASHTLRRSGRIDGWPGRNFPLDVAARLFGSIADIATGRPTTRAVVAGAAYYGPSRCPFGDLPGTGVFGSILLRPAGHHRSAPSSNTSSSSAASRPM